MAMTLDGLLKANPWVAAFAIGIAIGGGGGFGVSPLIKPNVEVVKSLAKIETALSNIENKLNASDRRLDNVQWRLDAHNDRLNGNNVKNREQDNRLQQLASDTVYLKALAPWESRRSSDGP